MKKQQEQDPTDRRACEIELNLYCKEDSLSSRKLMRVYHLVRLWLDVGRSR